jgi:choline dehydrogenase-like flavoprotein
MIPMPKLIDFSKCTGCGRCSTGCPVDAKWKASDFIEEACSKGATLVQDLRVTEIMHSGGRAEGVKGVGPQGELRVRAEVVVLSAGAMETPVVLQRSGIDSAGQKLFCDPFFAMFGSDTKNNFPREPRSILNRQFVKEKGFMLANCIGFKKAVAARYLPKLCFSDSEGGMLGILVKIKDDTVGNVYEDGRIKKILSENDVAKFKAGIKTAREILMAAGMSRKNILIEFLAGVHPGGTAAIGEVVDRNLETEIKNCFISDASVLPESPGLPPMLTIMALSKRLSKKILSM